METENIRDWQVPLSICGQFKDFDQASMASVFRQGQLLVEKLHEGQPLRPLAEGILQKINQGAGLARMEFVFFICHQEAYNRLLGRIPIGDGAFSGGRIEGERTPIDEAVLHYLTTTLIENFMAFIAAERHLLKIN